MSRGTAIALAGVLGVLWLWGRRRRANRSTAEVRLLEGVEGFATDVGNGFDTLFRPGELYATGRNILGGQIETVSQEDVDAGRVLQGG